MVAALDGWIPGGVGHALYKFGLGQHTVDVAERVKELGLLRFVAHVGGLEDTAAWFAAVRGALWWVR